MNKLQFLNTMILKSMMFFVFCFGQSIHAQQKEASTWIDFAEKKLTNNLAAAKLNDYSYSGYHFSEKHLPNIASWNTINVLDYGVVANDTSYDDAGIQAAINAAEASGIPTVVYFPAGRYIVSSEATKNKPIVIRKSNIVLKGAGAGNGGTEIYTDKFQDEVFPYRFQFAPTDITSTDITNVTSEIKKGDFEIQVASAVGLSVGQSIDLYQRNPNNVEANMSGLTPNPNWIRIISNGIRPYEKHIITAISGNKITFKNPIQLNMPVHSSTVLRTYNTIEEVGVENILFTSGWKEYPETFIHHANDIVDYAWRALHFGNVKNGWIRDCHFKDWNEVIEINSSIAVTVKDIEISGKRGHTSYYSRYSYGVLFENCVDNVNEGLARDNRKGMLHGPGMRWSTTSTVFIHCKMPRDQSIDCHGYHPYGNLLDNTIGGKLTGNGGAENAYPNSGPYLTFWNFKHDADFRNRAYNFWFNSNGSDRKTETFAYPNFVGFQPGIGENITFQNEGLDELRGEHVYPTSLFDAQFQLRMYGGYMSASTSKNNNQAKLANDNELTTFWESEGPGSGEWLMLDLGINKTINQVIIKEPLSKIKDWKLEYWEGSEWKELEVGSEIGVEKLISLNSISARKIRLNILSMLPGQELVATSISEFKVTTVLDLASNNFTIEAVGETCKDKNNGKLIINAGATHDYIASINGMNYEFTKNLTIDDLSPETYDLCIEIKGTSTKQCYQITIADGLSLVGKISINKKSVNVSVTSGVGPYKVIKNGELVFETNQSNFSVNVNQGDNIQIQGKDACQGKVLKTINLLEDIKVYPNPSNGLFELYVPDSLDKVDLEVYNVHAQLLKAKTFDVNAGKVQVDIKEYLNGIYFLKVNTKKPVFIKVIKN